MAERVLRHLGRHARTGRGHQVDVGVDHLRAALQGVGVPPGPAAFHSPDRGRHPRHRGGGGELRRDHLRQGRGRAQAAGGLRRAGELRRGCPEVLRRARVRQRDAGGPAVRTRGHLRPRPGLLVRRMAPDRGREHPAAVLLGRRGRPVHRVRGGTGSCRQPPRAPLAPHRHRAVRPDRGRAHPPAPHRDRRDRPAHQANGTRRPAAPGPGPGQRRGPDLRQDPARLSTRWPPSSSRSGRSRTRSRRRCAGPPPGT